MYQVQSGELLQDVEITGDEGVLGDDGDRIAKFEKDFETTARDLKSTLDGLVTVGVAGEGDDLWLPGLLAEGVTQQFGGVLFDEDACLKVDACRKAQILMCGTSVAVDATMFAASVWIEAELETDIGAVV
jgi:hypothetical protein